MEGGVMFESLRQLITTLIESLFLIIKIVALLSVGFAAGYFIRFIRSRRNAVAINTEDVELAIDNLEYVTKGAKKEIVDLLNRLKLPTQPHAQEASVRHKPTTWEEDKSNARGARWLRFPRMLKGLISKSPHRGNNPASSPNDPLIARLDQV